VSEEAKISVRGLNAFFRSTRALRDVTLDVPAKSVLAVIGPSGCGKSTFVRCINRMHELQAGATVSGQIIIDDRDMPGTWTPCCSAGAWAWSSRGRTRSRA
jgi:phosphate transport system ATP-binding protein